MEIIKNINVVSCSDWDREISLPDNNTYQKIDVVNIDGMVELPDELKSSGTRGIQTHRIGVMGISDEALNEMLK